MKNHEHIKHNRHWKVRIAVNLFILLLAFIALILVNFHAQSSWAFIRLMAVADAILSLFLFWYLNRGKHIVNRATIWHHLLHWVGMLACVYMIAMFVHSGIIGSNQAGLMVITILSLGLFLAGVYTEPTFLLIGVTLGIFAVAAAYIESYLTVFMLPVLLIAGGVIFVIYFNSKRKVHNK